MGGVPSPFDSWLANLGLKTFELRMQRHCENAMQVAHFLDRFDSEGLPARRVQLIHENTLTAFAAGQRYAEYLQVPATGEFGNIELPPGTMPAADLLDEPHIEIIRFSFFNPDAFTGDFATEIRFGYLVEDGMRKPFKGGQLVGNYMDALADVRWSAETGIFGGYLGPHTARFSNLTLSGPTG